MRSHTTSSCTCCTPSRSWATSTQTTSSATGGTASTSAWCTTCTCGPRPRSSSTTGSETTGPAGSREGTWRPMTDCPTTETEEFVADVRRQAEYEADRFPNDDWPPIVLALLDRLD